MSKKLKVKVATPGSAALDLTRRARTQLERRDYFAAWRFAREACEKELTPERKQLLQQARIGVAEKLLADSRVDDARVRLREVLAEGDIPADQIPKLGPLLSKLGLFDEVLSPDADEATRQQALAILADLLVVETVVVKHADAEMIGLSTRVREALVAVEKGDDELAKTSLQDIPRQSPFADWRLFVRGLSAYYRRESSEMAANWDRLTPNRAAFRIASMLRQFEGDSAKLLANTKGMDTKGQFVERANFWSKISAIERSALAGNGDLLQLLVELRHGLDKRDWTTTEIKAWRRQLLAVDKRSPELFREIGLALYEEFETALNLESTDYEDLDAIDAWQDLIDMFEGPPHDPDWDAFDGRALEREKQDLVSFEDAWTQYLELLPDLNCFSALEKRLVEAMVCARLANVFMHVSGLGFDDMSPHAGALKSAEKYLRRAVKVEPNYQRAQKMLSDLFTQWERPKLELAHRRTYAEQFPDDADNWRELARCEFAAGSPPLAYAAIERAKKLKPLDQGMRNQAMILCWSAVAACAGKKDFGEARRILADCLATQPEFAGTLLHSAFTCMVEFLAGDKSAMDRLESEAAAKPEREAIARFVLALESRTFKLPIAERKRSIDKWLAVAQHGQLSPEVLYNLLPWAMRDPAKTADVVKHQRQVFDGIEKVLQRGLAMQCSAETFVAALVVLSKWPMLAMLKPKWIAKAQRDFPDSPMVLMALAGTELEQGPLDCNPDKASAWLKKAESILLAAAQPEPVLIAEVRRMIAALEEIRKQSLSPIGMIREMFEAMGGSPDKMERVMADLLNGDDLEGLDDFIDLPPIRKKSKRR